MEILNAVLAECMGRVRCEESALSYDGIRLHISTDVEEFLKDLGAVIHLDEPYLTITETDLNVLIEKVKVDLKSPNVNRSIQAVLGLIVCGLSSVVKGVKEEYEAQGPQFVFEGIWIRRFTDYINPKRDEEVNCGDFFATVEMNEHTRLLRTFNGYPEVPRFSSDNKYVLVECNQQLKDMTNFTVKEIDGKDHFMIDFNTILDMVIALKSDDFEQKDFFSLIFAVHCFNKLKVIEPERAFKIVSSGNLEELLEVTYRSLWIEGRELFEKLWDLLNADCMFVKFVKGPYLSMIFDQHQADWYYLITPWKEYKVMYGRDDINDVFMYDSFKNTVKRVLIMKAVANNMPLVTIQKLTKDFTIKPEESRDRFWSLSANQLMFASKLTDMMKEMEFSKEDMAENQSQEKSFQEKIIELMKQYPDVQSVHIHRRPENKYSLEVKTITE